MEMDHLAAAGCPPGGEVWTDGRCVPSGILHAWAPWLLDYALPVVAAVVVFVMARDAWRKRTLTWFLLISVASATTWWAETFGDWGQHLSYSPLFNHYVVTWPYTAPHNPLWMPLMYSVYWVAHAWVILKLAQWWARRFHSTVGWGIVVLSIPMTFVWNLMVEGFAAWAGWWTYDPGIGPVLDMGRGNWPLLWPMLLMFSWINLIAWTVGAPEDADQPNKLEKLFGLDRLLARPGWHRELPRTDGPVSASGDLAVATRTQVLTSQGTARWQALRFLAWVVYFNVTFVICYMPLVVVRIVSGWDTPYF